MPYVVLQPASNREAQKHYRNTIASPVPQSDPATRERGDVRPAPRAVSWGKSVGVGSDTRETEYEFGATHGRGGPGPLLPKGMFISKTHVTLFDMGNRSLAVNLWGTTDDGVTWEHVYFLAEPEEISIPYHDLWEVAQHGPEDVLRGLTVLPEQKSRRVLAAFEELATGATAPQVDEDEYRQAALTLDRLDKKRETLARTEQSFLRQQLVGTQDVGECGICGRDFPVEFLVAAHIKKRAECSDDEKRDYANNVMLMCRFGCDELFERGWIAVQSGQVRARRPDTVTEAVIRHLQRVHSNMCDHWSEGSSRYFRWHAVNVAELI